MPQSTTVNRPIVRMQGFIIFLDDGDRYAEFLQAMLSWSSRARSGTRKTE